MRKTWALVMSILLMVTLMSGCNSSSETSDNTTAGEGSAGGSQIAATEGTTIKLLTHYNEEIDAIKSVFEEETGITVEVDYCSFDELTDTYEVILSSGSSEYDVLVVDGPNTAAYAFRGYLEPLNSCFTDEEINAFSPSLIEQGTVDESFYTAPLGDSSTILYYNNNLLEEAGVEWDWDQYDGEKRITWEELIDIAREVQDKVDPDNSKNITGIEFGQVSLVYMMNLLANSMGGANISEDGLSISGILDSEPWLNTLNWYQGLVDEGVFSRGIAVGETYNNFYVDKAAFIIMTADSIPYAEAAGMTAEEYGYTYVPAFEGYESEVATGSGNWTMAINSNSKNKEAAGQFVNWMTNGEGNDLFLDESYLVPNMDSRFTEEAFVGNPVLKLAQYEVANTAVVRAVTPGFNEYSAALNTMWEDIRNGSDIEQTVASTIEQVDKALATYK